MRDLTGPRRQTVLAALAAILLLATVVCWLHWENAVSLRGTAEASSYVKLAREPEDVMLDAQAGLNEERTLPVYVDGERSFVLLLEEPTLENGLLRIEGAMLRFDQQVGEVCMQVGLIPLDGNGDAFAPWTDEIVLLNTQMVRWDWQAAQALGFDDHCGFCAVAERKRLADGRYAVVLLDESDGGKRLIDAQTNIILTEGGVESWRI